MKEDVFQTNQEGEDQGEAPTVTESLHSTGCPHVALCGAHSAWSQ